VSRDSRGRRRASRPTAACVTGLSDTLAFPCWPRDQCAYSPLAFRAPGGHVPEGVTASRVTRPGSQGPCSAPRMSTITIRAVSLTCSPDPRSTRANRVSADYSNSRSTRPYTLVSVISRLRNLWSPSLRPRLNARRWACPGQPIVHAVRIWGRTVSSPSCVRLASQVFYSVAPLTTGDVRRV
jgi:hypothetical protein